MMKKDQEKLLNTLQEIGEIAENCLHGTTPLIAEQVFGSPLRNIRRLAFEAVESQTEPRPDLVIPCAPEKADLQALLELERQLCAVIKGREK
jgi:hypothetical protein